jgi:hypothetical protein
MTFVILVVSPQDLILKYEISILKHLDSVSIKMSHVLKYSARPFSSPRHPDQLWGPHNLLSNGYGEWGKGKGT